MQRLKKIFYFVKKYFSGSRKVAEDDMLPFMTDNPQYSKYSVGIYTYGRPNIANYYRGAYVVQADGSSRHEKQTITIGKFCSIAENVSFLINVDHRTDWISTYPFSQALAELSSHEGHPASKGSITIGNDVWIGRGATLLSGVTIGNGAVIGAQAVVTKDVPSYAVCAGNPAKVIRLRFSPETIAKLNDLSWWDLPEAEVIKIAPLLMSNRIEIFFEYMEQRLGSQVKCNH